MIKVKRIDLLKLLVFAGLLIISIVFLVENRQALMHIKIESIVRFAQAKNTRIYAVIMVLAVFTIKPLFVIIPNSVIAIVSGFMFGPFEGFVISIIGYCISSTICFYIAKLLGRNFMEKIMGEKLGEIERKLQKNQFAIILSLRLIPIIPLGPVNYACGLVGVDYKKFISATLIGGIPEVICYTFLGKNVTRPTSPAFIISIVILVSVVIGSKVIMKKDKKLKEN
ncbi:TVP38/TMEM64 family protein [uncultured Clostridium sp.]|uniref:TVP38/TMEM64 family protein n=1 Tax=uncultured Clostridium sp. TaxID=59620 RepID=UPI00261C7D07|nr:TVP38/TMEM64 family protein [uncultured Clostridium sp.]